MVKRRLRDVALIAAGVLLGAILFWWLGGREDRRPDVPAEHAAAEETPAPEAHAGAIEDAVEARRARRTVGHIVPPQAGAPAEAPAPAEPTPVPTPTAELGEVAEPPPEHDEDEADAASAGAVVFASAMLAVETRWEGAVPEPQTPVINDPKCPRGLRAQPYAVQGGRLSEVLVYIEDARVLWHKPVETPAHVAFRGCGVEPRVLALAKNQPLVIENADAVLHTAHGFSKDEFALALPKRGQRMERRFRHAELNVAFRCDAHPFEHATVHVLDHPFFAVTDGEGRAAIRGLPAGDYTLVALHPALAPQRKRIRFDGVLLAETFTFGAPETDTSAQPLSAR